MAPKVQKSKEAKALAAMSASKGKGKKKKWSKGKVREKKMHNVVFTPALWEKLQKDAPKKMKVISVYSLSEQFNITASLARRAITELSKNGVIKPVCTHSKLILYTKA